MPRRKKKQRGLLGTVVKIALAGKIALLGAFYLGAKNHTAVERLEDSLFYRNVPVAEGSFPDPAGVKVVQRINKYGEKEAWLVHEESGRQYELGENLLPRDLRVIERGLEERLGRSRDQYTPDETRERIDALARRAQRENTECLAQFEIWDNAISSASKMSSISPYESCEMLIAVAGNTRLLMEQEISKRDSYIQEISGIISRSAHIPPGACESTIASLREGKRMLRETIARYDKHLEQLFGIRERLRENQNL